jgi:superfamily II DNA or RNA helicase
MNLEFNFVKTVARDGILYNMERADVSRSSHFWAFWRSEAAIEFKKYLYISAENGKFFLYRLKHPSNPAEYGVFNLMYVLKNPSNLLPYQPIAVRHIVQSILDNGAAIDGSDTGLGKTYVSLAAARELNLKPYIICKIAGVASWIKVCKYMSVTPAIITNWEQARTGKLKVNGKPLLTRTKRQFSSEVSEMAKKFGGSEITEYKNRYDYLWNLPTGGILIFDECHVACNEDSQNYALWNASKGIASVSCSATFADRPSRLKGLFNVVRIMPEDKFEDWLLERDHFLNQFNVVESLTSIADMKALNKVLYPKYGYRIAYEDPEVKAFFPEVIIQTHIIDLGYKITVEQNKQYEDMLAKATAYKEAGKQAQALVADLRYRQYAELLKADSLVDMIKEYLEQGFCPCVFVNFRETLKYLSESLKTKSLIFGNQEKYGLKREEVVENFQMGKNRLILCMSEAGGQSISLHDVNGTGRRISLICPTYNPITLKQVLGRTRRAGSKTTPIIKLVYAAGTIEEKVAERVNEKLDNISALNNGDLMEPDIFNLMGKS